MPVIEEIKFYTIQDTVETLRVTAQTIRASIKRGNSGARGTGDLFLLQRIIKRIF